MQPDKISSLLIQYWIWW